MKKNYQIIKKEQIETLLKVNTNWGFSMAIRYALGKRGWFYKEFSDLKIKEFKTTYHVSGFRK